MKIEDGQTLIGDAIIGADGNGSISHLEVKPYASPFPCGKNYYRWTIPMERIHSDPETRTLLDEAGQGSVITDRDKRLVIYPCRSNTAMNFAAFLPRSDGLVTPIGRRFYSRGDAMLSADREAEKYPLCRKDLIQTSFAEAFPAPRQVLSFAKEEEIKVWQLVDMEPLQSWTADKVDLTGDAAHPFMPFLGQGGAMAVEDAVSLARFLPARTEADDVPERLKLLERIRHDGANYIQGETRLRGMGSASKPVVERLRVRAALMYIQAGMGI